MLILRETNTLCPRSALCPGLSGEDRGMSLFAVLMLGRSNDKEHRMKNVFVQWVLLGGLLICAVASGAEQDGADPLKLETTRDKASYSLGVKFGEAFGQGKDLLDIDIVVRALRDVYEGRDLAMDMDDVNRTFAGFQQAMRKRIMEAAKVAGESAKADGEAFLAANAGKEGVIVLDSGLQYKVLEDGAGATPTRADTVKTHYRGTLVDGTEFDSSYARGTPAEFPVTQVIGGWTEALLLMREGAKWELYIPSDLAYGPRGAPPKIPPHAALVFQIEVLEIVK